MTTAIAIDPGLNGAIAVFQGQTLERVIDMPVVKVGTKRKIATQALGLLLSAMEIGHAYLEQMHPGQFATAAMGMGRAEGIPEGILWHVPLTYCPPTVWKRVMQVTADKGSSRRRAMQLFPAHAADFMRPCDDGRAEAALIGAYGLGGRL